MDQFCVDQSNELFIINRIKLISHKAFSACDSDLQFIIFSSSSSTSTLFYTHIGYACSNPKTAVNHHIPSNEFEHSNPPQHFNKRWCTVYIQIGLTDALWPLKCVIVGQLTKHTQLDLMVSGLIPVPPPIAPNVCVWGKWKLL